MKTKNLQFSFWLGLSLCFLAVVAWQMPNKINRKVPYQASALNLNGAWRLIKTSDPDRTALDVVKIVADGSFTFADYNLQEKKFIRAGGGTYSLSKNSYTEKLEYLTQDSTRVGTDWVYAYNLKGKMLTLTGNRNGQKITETWERLDGGINDKAPLAGAWRIRERETQPGQMTTIQRGPRKTMKWLSGTRFQWAAINTETKQFFGTGGGTYTLQNGRYTEHIDFFSRDANRVGMDVSFDYEVKAGEWHHRGMSTAGNRIYEIWAREK